MIVFLFNLELHLRIVGILLLLLVPFNLYLPRRFGWHTELAQLSLFPRQVFIIHCFFIILILALMGLLCLLFAPALLQPAPLARPLLAGLATFWLIRVVMQFFYYSPKLWRGNPTHTAAHILFSFIWIYFTTVFTIAFFAPRH